MASALCLTQAVCFFLVVSSVYATLQSSCNAEDGTCEIAESPRVGSAMLQSSMGSVMSSTDAPLVGRVTTMMAEVASLQDRVAVLLDDVGVETALHQEKAASTAPSKLAKRMLNATALYARYKELLQTKTYKDETLKEDIGTLEADCSDLRSKIMMLENQVQDKASLFASYAYNPTSMASRVEAVEKDVASFRARVTSLEQVVAGLQVKAKASLLDVSMESESQLGPLSNRLSSLETEVASLQNRADHMESVVQGGSGGALLAEAELPELDEIAPVKPHGHQAELPELDEIVPVKPRGRKNRASLVQSSGGQASTIKERTANLETSVAALISKLEMLENQVSGSTSGDGPSFMQLQASKGSGADLVRRINSLEREVDSLRTRVSNLEHVVEG